MSRAALDAASGSSGLPLDFYRTYNFSGHNVLQYFDTVDALPLSELSLCSGYFYSTLLASYVQFSGDADGVVTEGGTSTANCRDERWWPAPACRSQYPQCIPVVTLWPGSYLQAIMQQMTAYAFPAAVGVSSGWTLFESLARTYRCLHYWWIPDELFLDVHPAQLVLPRHRSDEWAAGDQKTMVGPTAVSKVVSQDLQAKAWIVQEFISNSRFEMQEVQDLLLERKTSTSYDVACKWIRENRDRWTSWKPTATNCPQGFGLVNSSGHYVSVRADAVACEACPAGTTLVGAVDASGSFSHCTPCESGHFQTGTGATTCEPCPPGSTATAGGTRCLPCALGEYQALHGQGTCLSCGQDRTTNVLGATSSTECECKVGFLEVDGACVATTTTVTTMTVTTMTVTTPTSTSTLTSTTRLASTLTSTSEAPTLTTTQAASTEPQTSTTASVAAEVTGCMSLEISDPGFVGSTEAADALKETWRRGSLGSNMASPLANCWVGGFLGFDQGGSGELGRCGCDARHGGRGDLPR